MGFESIKIFEDKIANFFGSKYAVATDCCTHALELCLRYSHAEKVSVPRHTYISVPFLASKLSLGLEWRDENPVLQCDAFCSPGKQKRRSANTGLQMRRCWPAGWLGLQPEMLISAYTPP